MVLLLTVMNMDRSLKTCSNQYIIIYVYIYIYLYIYIYVYIYILEVNKVCFFFLVLQFLLAAWVVSLAVYFGLYPVLTPVWHLPKGPVMYLYQDVSTSNCQNDSTQSQFPLVRQWLVGRRVGVSTRTHWPLTLSIAARLYDDALPPMNANDIPQPRWPGMNTSPLPPQLVINLSDKFGILDHLKG